MDTYKFSITPVDTKIQLPFNLTETALTQWLKNLPKPVEAKPILCAIQAINKENDLTKTSKLSFLENIYHLVPAILEPLKQTILNSALPLSPEELDSARNIVSIHAELANGFASCITNRSNRSSAKTLFYGLQSLITAYIHISEVYQQPFSNFWKQSYKLYGLACKLQIQDQKIAHYKGHSNTISKAFKHLLALYHCGLEQFRPRDMLAISTILEKNTSLMLIDIQITPINSTLYSGFDLNTNTAPTTIPRLKTTEESTLRFFSAYSVAAEISKNVQVEANGTGVLKSINVRNILQAAKTLSLSQKRKFTRFNEKKIKTGIIGFNTIIAELAKVSSLSPTTSASITEYDPRFVGGWRIPNLELVTEGYESLDVMRGKLDQDQNLMLPEEKIRLSPEKKIFDANNNIDSSNSRIWDTPSDSKQQEPSSSANSELDIHDSSVKGYKVVYNTRGDHTARLQIGDIIGIKNNESIEIGIIRRILQLSEHKLQLGIKLLGLKAELAYISLPKHHSVYAWVLFLPGIKVLNTADSIVFNDNKFQRGEFVNLYRTDKEVVAFRLSKLLNISSAAMHMELFPTSIMDEL